MSSSWTFCGRRFISVALPPPSGDIPYVHVQLYCLSPNESVQCIGTSCTVISIVDIVHKTIGAPLYTFLNIYYSLLTVDASAAELTGWGQERIAWFNSCWLAHHNQL